MKVVVIASQKTVRTAGLNPALLAKPTLRHIARLEDLTDPVAAKQFVESKTAPKLTPEMVDFFADSAVELLRRNAVFQRFIR